MKQTGKSWKNAEGESTLAKYLPAHDRLFEKLGQKIAAEALDLEHRLREARALFIDACKEALRNSPDQNIRRRFSFYTFDREFRIEYDIKEEYVRVYRATKSNPSSKDYELIPLDFNKSSIVMVGSGDTQEEPLVLTTSFETSKDTPDIWPNDIKPSVYDRNLEGIDQERGRAYTENRPAPEDEQVSQEESSNAFLNFDQKQE